MGRTGERVTDMTWLGYCLTCHLEKVVCDCRECREDRALAGVTVAQTGPCQAGKGRL